MGPAHGCNNTLPFPGGAHQYGVDLCSTHVGVSVVVPLYKTWEKLTLDQSRCKQQPPTWSLN